MKTLVFRGTPVTCAKDVKDLLNAVQQDMSLRKVGIGSDMLINAAIYHAMRQQWIKIFPHIAAEPMVRSVGHSLGGDHALASPAFMPRSIMPRVFAFAPFQCANEQFWKAVYDGRPAPLLFGRAMDFAPGWDHLDRDTCLAGEICHLLGAGQTKMVNVWPWIEESIGDHSIDRYVADLELVPDAQEALTMCRLSSAIYLTDPADAIDRFTAMGFQTLDMIEAEGFRCAVLESAS